MNGIRCLADDLFVLREENYYIFYPKFHLELMANSFSEIKCFLPSITLGFKDTHREKVPSNKTPALTKCTNMGIWVVGIFNQLFRRGS